MENTLYQYSVLAALMHGVCRTGTPLRNVLTHGDHGLGTTTGLDGELIIVDGTAYLFPFDGSLRILDDSTSIPFIMATRFNPTFLETLPTLSMSGLSEALSPLLPSAQNNFISIKLEGLFPSLSFRVVPAQSRPYQPLAELAKDQVIKECRDVRGVLFGFWSPKFASGFSVAGFHLHFISDDRKSGGHVMAFEARDVHLQAARITDYHIELPTSGEFHSMPIGTVEEAEIHAVEGTH